VTGERILRCTVQTSSIRRRLAAPTLPVRRRRCHHLHRHHQRTCTMPLPQRARCCCSDSRRCWLKPSRPSARRRVRDAPAPAAPRLPCSWRRKSGTTFHHVSLTRCVATELSLLHHHSHRLLLQLTFRHPSHLWSVLFYCLHFYDT